VAAFVSALIEEFGDEWGNKWMFHLRWAREVDQVASARRIASSMLAKANEEQVEAMAEQIRERMLGRVWFVGSSEQTGPQIEASFREGLAELDAHLATRPYLFGARPAFGDFGLWGQVYEAWTDPTGAALVETVPNVLDWVHRMTWPRAEGEFEAWSSLEETLMPFLQNQIGKRFLPWTLANERAVAEGSEEFSVELGGQTWTQKPQKYHAKSLAALREKYAAAQSDSLDPILESAGCLAGLQA
jgi:glutathione S-transferase